MKLFDNPPKSWGGKVNFVDKNNVVVGFDYTSSCCENFGYLLTEHLPTSTSSPEVSIDSLEPYVFDTEFRGSPNLGNTDGGGEVSFKLVAPGLPDRYLTLFNHHNGYYSHGFDVTKDGKVLDSGSL
jgi:hypothetical protein